MPKIADAFRGDGALSLGRPPSVPVLAAPSGSSAPATAPSCPNWIAALDGVADKLAAGGTRRRRRLRARRLGGRARRRPSRTRSITGFDFHAPSIDTARLRADEAGVAAADDVRGRRRQELPGHLRPDLLLRLPARHGRPGRHRPLRPRAPADGRHRAARRAVRHRRPRRQHRRATRWLPLLYTASSTICTPNSLSQEVGLGLGAQAGEARLRQVFEDAGFTHVPAGRRDAAEPRSSKPSAEVSVPAATTHRAGRAGRFTLHVVASPAVDDDVGLVERFAAATSRRSSNWSPLPATAAAPRRDDRRQPCRRGGGVPGHVARRSPWRGTVRRTLIVQDLAVSGAAQPRDGPARAVNSARAAPMTTSSNASTGTGRGRNRRCPGPIESMTGSSPKTSLIASTICCRRSLISNGKSSCCATSKASAARRCCSTRHQRRQPTRAAAPRPRQAARAVDS